MIQDDSADEQSPLRRPSQDSRDTSTLAGFLWSFVARDDEKTPQRPSSGLASSGSRPLRRSGAVRPGAFGGGDSMLPALDWMDAVQLSVWDNIAGPMCEHVWSPAVERMPEQSLLLLAARHSLSGDIVAPDPLHIESRMYVFGEQGKVVHSVVFHTSSEPGGGGGGGVFSPGASLSLTATTTKHSLSIIYPTSARSRARLLQPVIDERLMRLSYALRALINENVPNTKGVFQALLLKVAHNLRQCFRAPPPLPKPAPPTPTSLRSTAPMSPASAAMATEAIIFTDPRWSSNTKYLALVLTSHLQTFGHTVVYCGDAPVGGTPAGSAHRRRTESTSANTTMTTTTLKRAATAATVELFTRSLVLTLPPTEQLRCRAASGDEEHNVYVPDIIVQGLMDAAGRSRAGTADAGDGRDEDDDGASLGVSGDSSGDDELDDGASGGGSMRDIGAAVDVHAAVDRIMSADQLLLPLFPTTILLPERLSVLQLNREITHLVKEAGSGSASAPATPRGASPPPRPPHYFRQIRRPAPLVEEMLQEMMAIPPHLRIGYLLNWTRLLMRQAVTMIEFAAAESAAVTNVTPPPPLPPSSVKHLRHSLALESDEDFAVMLAQAETLKAGTYVMLTGDPAVVEEQYRPLFEF